MPRPARKKRSKADPNAWLTTYGDMVTLVLCFFITMMGDPSKDDSRTPLIVAAFGGLGPLTGGMTLSPGKLAMMGASIDAMPSEAKAKALEKSIKNAQSLIKEDVSNVIKSVTYVPERGLVITLGGDAFFKPGSADVDIERTRDALQRISGFLASDELAGNTFRVEGNTDVDEPIDPSVWPSGWELSGTRAINVMRYLASYGVSDRRFQVMGLADTKPIMEGDTPEALAYNRRVDIVILTEGHL